MEALEKTNAAFTNKLEITELEEMADAVLSVISTTRLTDYSIWSFAPEWAQWVAVDQDGTTTFFEREPRIRDNEWLPHGGGEFFVTTHEGDAEKWHMSLEKRP